MLWIFAMIALTEPRDAHAATEVKADVTHTVKRYRAQPAGQGWRMARGGLSTSPQADKGQRAKDQRVTFRRFQQ
jgi:hypothetical protein